MSQETRNPWPALIGLIRPEGRRYLLLVLGVTASALLPLVGPLIVGRVVDDVNRGAGAETVVRYGLGFLAVTVVAQAVAVLTSWYGNTIAWRTANALRVELTGHVLGLDHEFHRNHTPGELIQRIDGDVTHVSDFLSRVVGLIGSSLLTVVGALVILTVIDWRLGAMMIVYALVGTGAVVAMRRGAVDETDEAMSARARLYGGIEERLTASEDLRSNGAASHAIRRFVEDATAHVERGVDEERAFMRMWWAIQGSVAGGAVVSLLVGGWLVSRGAITVGSAFVMFQYLQLIKRPMEDIVDRLEMVQRAGTAMIRVADLRATAPSIADPDRPVSPPSGPLEVVFSDVSFDYGDGQPILRNIDLVLGAGRTVGVVGRTGSGKTTLSRLILRLIDAGEGTVTLGGVPIGRVGLDELRRRVALIPQEVQLVNGTIRDNITLFADEVDDSGSAGPTDSAVEDAIRQVGLGRLIDPAVNPDGVHAELGGAGTGLSAGESQLIALARVWLRNPDVVVLDEATARVDPETEARLQREVSRLLDGRTAIVIAHRLSTLREVDDIVVMDQGRVIEHGRRRDLEADATGRFRHLLDLALEDPAAADSVPAP